MALKIVWIQLKIRETESVINNPVDLDQTPFECLRNYAPNPDKFRYSEPHTSRNNLIINQLKIDIISDLINRPDANNNNDNGDDQTPALSKPEALVFPFLKKLSIITQLNPCRQGQQTFRERGKYQTSKNYYRNVFFATKWTIHIWNLERLSQARTKLSHNFENDKFVPFFTVQK